MPNQRALAAALGLSQTTVARALRGSPKVKPETLLRVREEARKFGYRPNPMVVTLMEHIRSGKEIVNQGSIAILIDAESEEDEILRTEAYKLQLEGFVQRAQLRGYNTEIFFLRGKGITSEKLDRMLYSRGFAGIILTAPSRRQQPSFQLRWERYAVASVSYSWSYLPIDRASSDHRDNVHLAFSELEARGYERIGLALPGNALNPQDRTWLTGYLACQYDLTKSRRLPVFEGSVPEGSEEKFRRWHGQWKPDALLCLLGEEIAWIDQLSPRNSMALVCLNRPAGSDFCGIEENNFLVGELTCDIVVNHIIHNERGLSANPRRILVKGTWVEGKTLPARKPGAANKAKP